jgi:hypothetical protein
MPLFFMHLRAPSHDLMDPDGAVMSEGAVAVAALTAARDCMAHDIRSGRLELAYRIEVHDEAGEVVHTLQFADAVNITPA